MRRSVGFCAALAVASWAFAQGAKLKIEFAGEGSREVWFSKTGDEGTVKSAVSSSGTSIEVDVPNPAQGWTAFAHDKKTGDVAEISLDKLKGASLWKVDFKSARRIYRMDFRVESKGKPIASALIVARAGGETRNALVGPTDKGVASIYNVPTGKVEVAVEYKSKSGNETSPTQTFEAKLGAGEPAVRVLSVDGDVETIADPKPESKVEAKTEGAQSKAAPSTPAPNPLVSLLNLVIGLGVIGGILYFVWNYVKKNPSQVEDGLKKLGLGEVNQPADPGPPVPAAPQPIKQIVLGDAPPTAVVSASQPVVATAVANPRLVRSDGSVVLLADGDSVVGREEGLGVSLAGESSVSRNHAVLRKMGEAVSVIDSGSTNGTFVNGQKVTGEQQLNPGDSVQFGAVGFRYEV